MRQNEPLLSGKGASDSDRAKAAARPPNRRRWRRRSIGGIVLLVAGGVGLGALGPLSSATPAMKYRLAPIDAGPIVSAVATAGTLKPLAAILVGSQASGQIKELLADFNSPVKAGDVIARLNDDAVRARLAQAVVETEVAAAAAEIQRAQLPRAQADADGARAALLVAQADMERAEAALKDAERERQRKQDLFARGVGSAAERDRSDAAHDSAHAQLAAAKARIMGAVSAQVGTEAMIHIARAQLDNALAQVKQRESVVQQVRVDLDHTVIRAPIDGVVIDRTVDVGQTVAASLQAPTLFTIAPDLRTMELHANVDEAEIGRVLAGQEVSFTVDSHPGRAFPGRVVDIRKMPQTTQNVVTYTVVISAENEDLLLLPGMTANLRILVQQRDDVLRLPNSALRFRPAGTSRPPTMIASAAPAPGRLLRSAVDRIGLSPARRDEMEQVIGEADCVATDAKDTRSTSEAGTHADACREAANRVFALLAPHERARYQAARSELARDPGITSADVWVVGPDGTPLARRLRLGISDGLVTEVLAGDLHTGDHVIVGAAVESARPAGLAGL